MTTFNHVTLVYGQTGQLVYFYPPMAELLAYGAATSGATYRVFQGTASNDDTPTVDTSSATLDSVSTTVSTASGYSQSVRTRVYLTSTTGVTVGRRYLLTNTQGQREIVVPTLVESSYVDVEEPLAYDYAITSSTFKGTLHYFTIGAAFIADSSNINVYGSAFPDGDTSTAAPPWRIEWRYTLGSTALRAWTSFDVRRKTAKSGLSIHDLRGLVPDVIWHEWIGQRGQDFSPQLEAAERDVAIDARAAGYDPAAVVDPQIWDRLILQRWALTIGKGLLFSSRSGDLGDWVQMTANDYQAMFQRLIGTALRAWIDTSTTGAVTPSPATQLWLRGR